MIYEINQTHDADLKSWIETANDPQTDFPLQNLPWCIFRARGDEEFGSPGIAIGDFVLAVHSCREAGLIDESLYEQACWAGDFLNFTVDRTSSDSISALTARLRELLSDSASPEDRKLIEPLLVPISEAEFFLPFAIDDYTDFYCSIYHATNVGSMFRPDNPLLPNYKYVPIGYHGRASSIVISGTEIKRPKRQNRSDPDTPPAYIPCKSLDYEMEVGFFVGHGNELGTTVPIAEAEEHIFGLCLVNDWSARDIQAWEYQPLGPFLAKNFATTVSPFVVTMEALAPFRTPAFKRDPEDPEPLDYLNDEQNQKLGGIDVNLEVYLQSAKMRDENIEPHLLSRSNMKDLYWTVGQMLTHHASNGCNLQTGDLIATGTISGNDKSERGSMLELSWRGTEPIELPNGETRRFLEDGDEIIMKGYCEREGFRRIGFGECRGRILPAE